LGAGRSISAGREGCDNERAIQERAIQDTQRAIQHRYSTDTGHPLSGHQRYRTPTSDTAIQQRYSSDTGHPAIQDTHFSQQRYSSSDTGQRYRTPTFQRGGEWASFFFLGVLAALIRVCFASMVSLFSKLHRFRDFVDGIRSDTGHPLFPAAIQQQRYQPAIQDTHFSAAPIQRHRYRAPIQDTHFSAEHRYSTHRYKTPTFQRAIQEAIQEGSDTGRQRYRTPTFQRGGEWASFFFLGVLSALPFSSHSGVLC
jgi:hypothetical protein